MLYYVDSLNVPPTQNMLDKEGLYSSTLLDSLSYSSTFSCLSCYNLLMVVGLAGPSPEGPAGIVKYAENKVSLQNARKVSVMQFSVATVFVKFIIVKNSILSPA